MPDIVDDTQAGPRLLVCFFRFAEEALAEADAVFTGRVTSVTVHGDDPPLVRSNDPVSVEFKVRSVWKGPRRKTLTVETERMGASCGFEFKEGREYVVYVSDGRTGLCSRTAPTWMALRDFAVLGSGWKPASISDSAPTAEHVPPPESTPAPRSPGCGLHQRLMAVRRMSLRWDWLLASYC